MADKPERNFLGTIAVNEKTGKATDPTLEQPEPSTKTSSDITLYGDDKKSIIISSNSKITYDDFIRGFWTNVYDAIVIQRTSTDEDITKDTMDNKNKDQFFYAYTVKKVTTNYPYTDQSLGNLETFKNDIMTCIQNSGTDNGEPDAERILKFLTEATSMLTRVGTWAFRFRYRNTKNGKTSYSKVVDASGRALYPSVYKTDINLLYSNTDKNNGYKMFVKNRMTVNGVKELYAALYNAWVNSKFPTSQKVVTVCHGSCQCDCNCKCDCESDCYKH